MCCEGEGGQSGEPTQDVPVPACIARTKAIGDAPSPCTSTQDEPSDGSVLVNAVVVPTRIPTGDAMPSRLPLPVRPLKRPSLDDSLANLEKEWAPPSVAANSLGTGQRGSFLLKTWALRATEQALAAEMVGGIVRSILSASRSESLLSLKKKARMGYPAFGYVVELVAQAAVDTRSGALAFCRPLPRPVEQKDPPSVKIETRRLEWSEKFFFQFSKASILKMCQMSIVTILQNYISF